eukprot:s1381_g18.t1
MAIPPQPVPRFWVFTAQDRFFFTNFDRSAMLSRAADTSSVGFKVTIALNLKGVLLLATSLWLLWGELESNCFSDVPQKEYKASRWDSHW